MLRMAVFGVLSVLAACAPEDPLTTSTAPRIAVAPRAPRPVRIPAGTLTHPQLVVKFIDEAEVRTAAPDALFSRRGTDLRTLEVVRDRYELAFAPLFSHAAPKIDHLRERARRRTGRPQPDLLGAASVHVPDATPELLAEIGAELQRLSVVEFAYLHDTRAPPPVDIDPPTPNLVAQQGYRGPATGIDADGAAAMGYDGTGIHIGDVEQNWNFIHEELADLDFQLEDGVEIWPDHDDNHHGTAVAGELIAGDNGYGMTGMTPGATMTAYPEIIDAAGIFRRNDAVASAVADAAEGDIVLLEIQEADPITGEFGPGETEEMVWLATRMGTDAGVVVVAAAGNGNVDLDREELAYYRDRGDSGAIIVGAGAAGSRDKLSFSTYGARVDVHGWGSQVFTTGYGNFAIYGDDPNQSYTATFGGTSSASPIVTAAAALVQQFAKDEGIGPLTSKQIRQLLKNTGLPQGNGGNIGPLPQVPAAIEAAGIPDLTAPELAFVVPDADVQVDQPMFSTGLEVAAADDSGLVVKVELAINGDLQPIADEIPPFAFDEVVFPEGLWEIVAFGTDVWGNVGESAPLLIAVGVELPEDPTTGMVESSSSSTGDDTTGPPPPPMTTAPPPEDDGDDESTGGPEAQPAAQEGCNCSTAPPPLTFLPLFALAVLRRRNRRR